MNVQNDYVFKWNSSAMGMLSRDVGGIGLGYGVMGW